MLSIAVDADDVVVDFTVGVIHSMYTEFGVLIRKEEIRTWDGGPIKDFDWGQYGYDDWFDWLRDRDWLWSIFPAVPGAIGGLRALHHRGHRVEIVTSKPEWADPQVARWFGKWRPKPMPPVRTVRLGEPKHVASQAQVIVDDRPTTILDWVDSDPYRYGILFWQPWGEEHAAALFDHDRIFVAYDWDDVLYYVDMIDEEVGDD